VCTTVGYSSLPCVHNGVYLLLSVHNGVYLLLSVHNGGYASLFLCAQRWLFLSPPVYNGGCTSIPVIPQGVPPSRLYLRVGYTSQDRW